MARDRVAAVIRLPYPSYLWKVIRRSAGMWLLVRSMYGLVAFFNLLPPAEGTAQALNPAWITRALLVALTTVLVWWDRWRSHELLLHANLGAWSGWFWTAPLLTALMLDIAVQTLLTAL